MGTLASAGNYRPWRDYRPHPNWLRSLWLDHKLAHDKYLELSLGFRGGHLQRKREAQECIQDENDAALKKQRLQAQAELYNSFPKVTAESHTEVEKDFIAQFRQKSVRYKALVYDGPSMTRKSVRASLLFGRLRAHVVDCQNAVVPDLRGLSWEEHDVLVLDEVIPVPAAMRTYMATATPPTTTMAARTARTETTTMTMMVASSDSKARMDAGTAMAGRRRRPLGRRAQQPHNDNNQVPSVQFALLNKKLLQSHVDGAKLGQSATQMYSYNIWWWRRPIIMTSNKWAQTLKAVKEHEPEDAEWLEANVMVQPMAAKLSDAMIQVSFLSRLLYAFVAMVLVKHVCPKYVTQSSEQ